jgi:hypothetical protein
MQGFHGDGRYGFEKVDAPASRHSVSKSLPHQ